MGYYEGLKNGHNFIHIYMNMERLSKTLLNKNQLTYGKDSPRN